MPNVDVGPYIPKALESIAELAVGPADISMVEALPHMDPIGRDHALALLVSRGHVPALARLVGTFHDASPAVQSAVVTSWRPMAGAFRAAMAGSLESRMGAIEAIVAADAVELAYLLSDALKSKCRPTRELAGHALSVMAEAVMLDGTSHAAQQSVDQRSQQLDLITNALGDALHSWEIHRNPSVLEAALSLGYRILPALRRKLERRPLRIDGPIRNVLLHTDNVRCAEFLWCALALRPVRATAIERLESLRHDEMILAVVNASWMLADSDIASGFRELRKCDWLANEDKTRFLMETSNPSRIVSLIAASGISHETKLRRFRSLWCAHHDEVRYAILWALVADRSRASTQLLIELHAQSTGSIAGWIEQEITRRGHTAPSRIQVLGNGLNSSVRSVGILCNELDQLFDSFDTCSPVERRARALALDTKTGRLHGGIARRLRSRDPMDNRRAITLVRELGRVEDFDIDIRRLAHDPDPRTRSLAVSMLVHLPGAATSRILRRALDDDNERVQANSLESLDRLDDPESVASFRRRLDAPSNRVRANAIHALLRRGDSRALSPLQEMLVTPQPRDRLSALWVVERLRLDGLRERLERMAALDPDERVRTRALRVCDELGLQSPAKEGTDYLGAIEDRSVDASSCLEKAAP